MAPRKELRKALRKALVKALWIGAGVALAAVSIGGLQAQDPPAQAPFAVNLPENPENPENFDLHTLIENAARQLDLYRSTIPTLDARETKTIALIDPAGRLEQQRTIESDLTVLRTSHATDGTRERLFEYRDVRIVDGQVVRDREERRHRLKRELASTTSVADEFARIVAESERFDLGLRVSGFYIDPHHWIRAAREAFEFEIVGIESVEGRRTVVVDYRQVRATDPPLVLGLGTIENTRTTMEGRAWIDAESLVVRKGEWRGLLHHDSFAEPLLMIRTVIEHGQSEHGISPVRSILYQAYLHSGRDAEGNMETSLSAEITFEYDTYTPTEALTLTGAR